MPQRTIRSCAVAVAIVAAGCGSSSARTDADPVGAGQSEAIGDEGAPVDGGTLVVAVDYEATGWNPSIDRWGPPTALVGSSVLEPLAVLDEDGEAQPWLATAWTPNETFDVWTVDLRDGVTFHDGAPLNAQALKDNLDFVVAAPLSGVAMKPLFREVVVVDGDTVEVRLTQPWAAFPSSFLAGQSSMLRSPASMLADDRGSTHPVGTGPFQFDEWVPDESFTVTAYDEYWRDGEPHLDGIEFRVITDPASRIAALEAGDVDMAMTTVPDDAARLEADFTVLRDWDVEPAVLLVNVRPTIGGEPNPVSNLHARRAMALAIDRDAIAATVGDGVEIPTSPFSPDGPWGQPTEDDGYPDFDLDAAKAEVAAYLDETGETSLEVTIGGSSGSSARVLELVEEQLRAAGIDATIEEREASALINSVVSADFEVALFPIYSSPDPDQNHYFFSAATAPGEGGININMTGLTTATMEEALREGRQNPDPDARREAYHALVEEVNANVSNLWLFTVPYSLVAAPEVKGLGAVGEVPFANFQPKTWLGGLWLGPQA